MALGGTREAPTRLEWRETEAEWWERVWGWLCCSGQMRHGHLSRHGYGRLKSRSANNNQHDYNNDNDDDDGDGDGDGDDNGDGDDDGDGAGDARQCNS